MRLESESCLADSSAVVAGAECGISSTSPGICAESLKRSECRRAATGESQAETVGVLAYYCLAHSPFQGTQHRWGPKRTAKCCKLVSELVSVAILFCHQKKLFCKKVMVFMDGVL